MGDSLKQQVIVKLEQLLKQHDLHVWLYGSFAVEVITGEVVNPKADIDLACATYDEYRAVSDLMRDDGWNKVRAFEWDVQGGRSANAIFVEPETHVELDVSYIRDEFLFAYNTEPLGQLQHVHMFSARELLMLYETYGHEKPSENERKIGLLRSVVEGRVG